MTKLSTNSGLKIIEFYHAQRIREVQRREVLLALKHDIGDAIIGD